MQNFGEKSLGILWARIKELLGWSNGKVSADIIPTLPQSKIDGLENALNTKFDKTGGTIYKQGESFPIKVKSGATTITDSVGIEFFGRDGAVMSRLMFESGTMSYYDGTYYRKVFHSNNANKATIDWLCKVLTATNVNASGDVVANGGVVAKGIADLTMYRI